MSDLRARLAAATRSAAEGPLAADRERPTLPPLPRDPSLVGTEALVARFRLELERLTGKVHGPADAVELADEVVATLRALGSDTILCWDESELGCPGLGAALTAAGVTLEQPLVPPTGARQSELERLAETPVGLTGALAGLADTGSIVVASGPGRARVASLLPPVHLAVLPVSRIHATLGDWLSQEFVALAEGAANVVTITGPSRTADIELIISLGVHGPKEIHVFLYAD